MPRSCPIRAATLFNRRARKSAGKEQHARIRPQQGETPALGQRASARRARHQLRQRQEHRHARQALVALLAAVAALVNPECGLHHLRERCHPGLSLEHEAAEWRATGRTAR
jgi:hypothetical protein